MANKRFATKDDLLAIAGEANGKYLGSDDLAAGANVSISTDSSTGVKTVSASNTGLYGRCTTAAGTAAKTVTIAGVTDLANGLAIRVGFENSNTAQSPTLNVNSLGAKPIYSASTVPAGTTAPESWEDDSVITLTYSTDVVGTGCWVMVDHVDISSKLDAADYHRALTWGEAKDRYTWGTIKGASDTSGQTTTTNLQLVKPGYGSSLDIAPINANSDTLDTAIKAVQDATDALEDARTNLNALLGNLGLNAQGQPLIDAASARSTLGAATDGNSGTTLYAAQQAIATNASAISTLRDSVGRKVHIETAQIATVHVWGGSSANFGLTLSWNNGDVRVVNLTRLAD